MFNKAKCKETHSSEHIFVGFFWFLFLFLEGIREGCDWEKMIGELEKTTRGETSLQWKKPLKNLEIYNTKSDWRGRMDRDLPQPDLIVTVFSPTWEGPQQEQE